MLNVCCTTIAWKRFRSMSQQTSRQSALSFSMPGARMKLPSNIASAAYRSSWEDFNRHSRRMSASSMPMPSYKVMLKGSGQPSLMMRVPVDCRGGMLAIRSTPSRAVYCHAEICSKEKAICRSAWFSMVEVAGLPVNSAPSAPSFNANRPCVRYRSCSLKSLIRTET